MDDLTHSFYILVKENGDIYAGMNKNDRIMWAKKVRYSHQLSSLELAKSVREKAYIPFCQIKQVECIYFVEEIDE